MCIFIVIVYPNHPTAVYDSQNASAVTLFNVNAHWGIKSDESHYNELNMPAASTGIAMYINIRRTALTLHSVMTVVVRSDPP